MYDTTIDPFLLFLEKKDIQEIEDWLKKKQKELLKQVVNDGLVINNKKRSNQLSFKFADIVDVSEYDTLDEKVNSILDADSVLQYIEEFEYKRQYRHFCYFKCSEIPPTKLEELVENDDVYLFDKKGETLIDSYNKPSLYIVDNLVYCIIDK